MEGKLEEARRGLENTIQASPTFVEAHVTLATVYYRLKRKADGDRERSLVQKLNAEIEPTHLVLRAVGLGPSLSLRPHDRETAPPVDPRQLARPQHSGCR